MKRGVQLYTVREFMNSKERMADSLAKIKAIGYDSVQGWVPPCMTCQEYLDLCKKNGLENCSSGGDYLTMLVDPEAIEIAVAQANAFGVTDIAIGTLPQEWRESKAGYQAYAKGVNLIAAQVKKAGKRLLYHPHALEFYSLGKGLKGMDIILGETDPDGLHFALDTHWLTSGGVDVADWIYKVKGRMSIVHFKDYAIVEGAEKIETVRKQFAEVGEGNIDWPKAIAACRDIGVEYVIVEQDICPGDPFDSLKTSFANMAEFGV